MQGSEENRNTEAERGSQEVVYFTVAWRAWDAAGSALFARDAWDRCVTPPFQGE